MYLRTTKRRNADGSEVRYFQLAENEWDRERGCAIAKVVYNFGRADGVDGDKLRRLARSILRVFSDGPTVEAAELGDVRLRDSWPYGGVYVLEQLWKELGIDEVLRSRARSKRTAAPFERALFTMVANRCLSPCSNLYSWEQWIREEVFLPSAQDLDLHQLYFAMDFLEVHKAEVEKSVYFAMADLLNADVDLIFYDTTSLHFEVDEEEAAAHSRFGRAYGSHPSGCGRSSAPKSALSPGARREAASRACTAPRRASGRSPRGPDACRDVAPLAGSRERRSAWQSALRSLRQ